MRRLKIRRGRPHAGSIPAPGTKGLRHLSTHIRGWRCAVFVQCLLPPPIHHYRQRLLSRNPPLHPAHPLLLTSGDGGVTVVLPVDPGPPLSVRLTTHAGHAAAVATQQGYVLVDQPLVGLREHGGMLPAGVAPGETEGLRFQLRLHRSGRSVGKGRRIGPRHVRPSSGLREIS